MKLEIGNNLVVTIIALFIFILVAMGLCRCGGGKTILEETHKKNVNGWFESDSTKDG